VKSAVSLELEYLEKTPLRRVDPWNLASQRTPSIEGKKEDRLNRSGFAETLAKITPP